MSYEEYLYGKSVFNYDQKQSAILFWDEFCANDIEVNGWGKSTAGTGSGDSKLTGGNAFELHPGVVQISTGTDTTGRCSVYQGNNEMVFGSTEFTFECMIRIPDLADATNDYNLFIGCHNGATSEPANGFYFEYDRDNSANWSAVTAKASSRTKTDTSTAVAADTWINLKIVIASDLSSGKFYIDDTLVATNTANIPDNTTNGSFAIFLINKEAGTTARTLLIDWCKGVAKFNTDRS